MGGEAGGVAMLRWMSIRIDGRPLRQGPENGAALPRQASRPGRCRVRTRGQCQKSIVADNCTVRGAPRARLDSSGMPQYALLVTLLTPARSASGRPAIVVA